MLATRILPAADETRPRGSIDLAGAVTVTMALMLAVYGIVGGNAAGWTWGRVAVITDHEAIHAGVIAGAGDIEQRLPVATGPATRSSGCPR